MRNRQGKEDKGFTLIELVIAMVILSILSMVAFPGYQKTVRKSRRVDAKVELLKVAQSLERCYTEYNSYNDDDSSGNPACAYVNDTAPRSIAFNTDNDAGDGYYTISSVDNDGTETLTSNGYTLYAWPTTKGSQNRDDACTEFSLDSVGRKRAQGLVPDNDSCW